MKRIFHSIITSVMYVVAATSIIIATPPVAYAVNYWTVLDTASDERGQKVPIRNGDATLGFTKACQKHNFCNLRLIRKTVEGRGDNQDVGGGRFKYTGHLVGDGVDITLIVMGDQNKRTRLGPTPDGLPVGVITAYCQGPVRCPDVVNHAPS